MSISNLHNYVIKSTGFRINDKGYITEIPEIKSENPHGTIISLIIKYLCENVQFISINILDHKLATDGRILIHALSRVLEYNPDIIHMSLGTTKWKYKFYLKRLIKKANKNGAILVAAANDQGLVSYPSHLKNVIAVKSSVMEHYEHYYYKNDFFYASGNARDVLSLKQIGSDRCFGSSYSAAYITGFVSQILSHKSSLKMSDVTNILIHKSNSKGEKDYV